MKKKIVYINLAQTFNICNSIKTVDVFIALILYKPSVGYLVSVNFYNIQISRWCLICLHFHKWFVFVNVEIHVSFKKMHLRLTRPVNDITDSAKSMNDFIMEIILLASDNKGKF